MLTIEHIKNTVQEPCRRYDVKKLELFGSAAKGDMREDSDLDFIVEFNSSDYKGMFDRYMGLLEELEMNFKRKIDLLTSRSIRNPFFKNSVEREKMTVYG